MFSKFGNSTLVLQCVLNSLTTDGVFIFLNGLCFFIVSGNNNGY